MSKLAALLGQALVAAYSLLGILRTPKYDRSKANKNLLVIWFGGIGDILLGLDFFKELVAIYGGGKGYQITVLCNPASKRFLQDAGELTDVILVGEPWLEIKGDHSSFKKCLIRHKETHYDIIINMIPGLRTSILMPNLIGEQKLKVDHARKKRRFLIMLFDRLGYTKVLRVPSDMMLFSRYRILMRELGNEEYKSSVFVLSKRHDFAPLSYDSYITVCLASTSTDRCWNSDKFARLINEIIQKWHIPIVLVGGKHEDAVYQKIKDSLIHPEYIDNRISQTSGADWIEIIRGSTLVIGVDSGCVHVAAATQTPSICLIGGWDYCMFHPYQPDVIREDDNIPVCVYSEIQFQCYRCKSVYQKRGYGNAACMKEIAKRNPVVCMREISVEAVMKQVAAFMDKQERVR